MECGRVDEMALGRSKPADRLPAVFTVDAIVATSLTRRLIIRDKIGGKCLRGFDSETG
jgi:hypothetical protein